MAMKEKNLEKGSEKKTKTTEGYRRTPPILPIKARERLTFIFENTRRTRNWSRKKKKKAHWEGGRTTGFGGKGKTPRVKANVQVDKKKEGTGI